MPKDYARTLLTDKRKHREKRGLPWSVIFLVGVLACIGLFYGVRGDQVLSKEQMVAWVTKAKSLVIKPKNPSGSDVLANKSSGTATTTPDDEVRFDFYTALPAMQVNKSVDQSIAQVNNQVNNQASNQLSRQVSQQASSQPINAEPATVPVTAPQFIVQYGLFKEPSGAAQLRLSLLLAGIEAEVVKINSNNSISYRVQKGPYTTEKLANAAQRPSQRKGIESIVKKSG